MFSPMDVLIIIGLVVGPIATMSITIYKVGKIEKKLKYWETKGIEKLKYYIQQELTIMDKRYEQRFEIIERRIKALEQLAGLIEKAQQYEFKNNRKRDNKNNDKKSST